MEEKFNLEYAKYKCEKLKQDKKNCLEMAFVMLMVSIGFAVVVAITIVQGTMFGAVLSLGCFIISCTVTILGFRGSSQDSKEIKAIEEKMVKHFKKKFDESLTEFLDSIDNMRERNEERRNTINVLSRPSDICSNLKFRDEIIANNCGKLTNKTLIEDFFNEKIADENFDDGSVVPVTIKMAIEKFKNYDFALQVPYRTMLKRYEEKQELLDKYNKQEQKPRAKRKTTKKK